MKFPSIALRCLIFLNCAFSALAAPTNDNFQDRIVLLGTDVTFAGDATEATTEEGSPVTEPDIWWSWTANADLEVAMMVSAAPAFNNGRMSVFAGTNVASLLSIWPSSYGVSVNSFGYGGFRATAGTTYSFCYFGGGPATFRLLATNAPVIVTHPTNQVVLTGDSLLLSVVAAASGRNYQWIREGSDLAGETNLMFVAHHVQSTNAGSYRVRIWNDLGTNTSQAAEIQVVTPALQTEIAITKGPSNLVAFTVGAPTNQTVYVEATTNLANWQQGLVYTNEGLWTVAIGSNGVGHLNVPIAGALRFHRVSRYEALGQICVCRLRQLNLAMFLWQHEAFKSTGDAVSIQDLQPYLHPREKGVTGALNCPLASPQSELEVSAIGAWPLCPHGPLRLGALPSHTLP
jgi:hypothetical protein